MNNIKKSTVFIKIIIYLMLSVIFIQSCQNSYIKYSFPSSPTPNDGQSDVDTDVVLKWEFQGAKGNTRFDIYLSKDINKVIDNDKNVKVATDLSNTSYKVEALSENTVYFWRVTVKVPNEPEINGPIWKFKTRNINSPPEKPTNPIPKNGDNEVSILTTLSWDAKDPDHDALLYDLYISTNKASVIDMEAGIKIANIKTNRYQPLQPFKKPVKYYWMVVAKDPFGEKATSDVWEFTTANFPPTKPHDPFPKVDERVAPLNPILSWISKDQDLDEVYYDLYLSTNPNMVENLNMESLVASNLTQSSLDVKKHNILLKEKTKYYWRVVSKDTFDASVVGNVWNFTTSENHSPIDPYNPFPENGANNIPVNVTLSWNAYDPDNDSLTYYVYISDNKNSVINNEESALVKGELQSTNLQLPNLQFEKTYYWKVIAKDIRGATSVSNLWNFTTALYSIVYGITSEGITLFGINKDGEIAPKNIGFLDGMNIFHDYRGIAFYNSFLYLIDRSENSLIKLKSNGDNFEVDNVYHPNHGCVERLKEESGLIIGYDGCDYFVYDPEQDKIILSEYAGDGCCVRAYASANDEYIAVVLSGGNVWNITNTHYKVILYDRNTLNPKYLDENSGDNFILRSVLLYRDKMYIAVEKDEGVYLYKYDISNLDSLKINSPKDSKPLFSEKSWDIDLKLVENKIAVINRERNFVNLIDPDTLEVLGNSGNDLQIDDIYSIPSMNVFISTRGNRGISTLDSNFNKLQDYDDNKDSAENITTNGTYVFVIDSGYRNKIYVYDRELKLLPSIDSYSDIKFVKAKENYLYTISGNDILILDISNPSEPSEIYKKSVDGVSKLLVTNNYLYAVPDDGIIVIFDISNIENVKKVGFINTNWQNRYVYANDEVFISGSWDEGFKIYNVSDKNNPKLVLKKTYEEDKERLGGPPVFVGNYAYVFVYIEDKGNFIEIYDISNPDNPTLLNNPSVDMCYEFRDIEYYDDYLIVAGCNHKIINIRNKTHPLYINDTPDLNYISIDETAGVMYATKWEKGVFAFNMTDLINSGDNTKPIYKDVWFTVYDVAVGK